MRKPEESLEDFTVKAITIESSEPQPVASLRFRGQVEVLKPLSSREGLANPNPATAARYVFGPPPFRFSWFQGALGAAGAVAVMAFVLLSAIFIGIYDPPVEPSVGPVDTAGVPSDAATNQQPEDSATRTERPLKSDIFAAQNSPPAGDELRPAPSTARPRLGRPDVQLSAHRPRRQPRRAQLVTRFVPTTLVIYAENGEIKTRIEPRLAAVHKKPLTITN